MKLQHKLILGTAALVGVLGLSACGGGGDGGFRGFPIATTPPPATSNPPPAASDPYDSFLAFVKDLVNKVLDTSEPANVTAFDPPPTSDTKEPIAAQ